MDEILKFRELEDNSEIIDKEIELLQMDIDRVKSRLQQHVSIQIEIINKINNKKNINFYVNLFNRN